MKIGQTLLSRGLLTQEQLSRALRTQRVRGGHLGTNLIELGYIDEPTLGRTLSEISGLTCASKDMFDDIPDALLSLLPAEEVIRRRLIPIGLKDRELHLAVIDPKHAAGLSASSGYRILPYIAPEMRIVQALERYYGAPRRLRFTFPKSDLQRFSSNFTGRSEGGARSGPVAISPAPRSTRRPVATAKVPEKPRARIVPNVDPGIAEQVNGQLRELSRRMSRVQSHVELGEVILDDAIQGAERRILFAVVDGKSQIADSRNAGLDRKLTNGLEFPVDEESIFSLADEELYYRGPLPEKFNRAAFYGRLGMHVPSEVVVLPIYGEGQLEAVFYGDGGPSGRIEQAGDPYPMMLEMVGIAARMLRLRLQLDPG